MFLRRLPGLFQGTLNECIFRIHDCCLGRLMQQGFQPFGFLHPGCDDLVPVREGLDDPGNLLVILEVLYCKVTG